MTTQSAKKSKQKQYVDTNPVEAIRDTFGGIISSTKDQGKGAVSDLWKQLLGAQSEQYSSSGDLSQGQELDLASLANEQEETEEKEKIDIEPGIDYKREILHGDKRISEQLTRSIGNQIQQIIIELKRLAESSSILEMEFKEVTVEQRIEHPGKYHITFFEWMLSVVKTARMRVEDSGAWLAQFKSKKKQKQYWNMFKKHGTTFGLSNERVVATQTG